MRIRKTLPALLLAASFLLAGCAAFQAETSPSPDPEAGELSRRYIESMDTFMSLTAYGSKREAALEAAQAEILRLDALLSIGSEASEVFRINREGGGQLSDDTAAIVGRAMELYEATGGCFDITISPLMELWGFYSGDYHIPDDRELAEAMARVGADHVIFDAAARRLTLDPGQAIDLGGIAKGYTSQRIVELWRDMGLSSGIVSLGGNVQCLGTRPDGTPWRIGIQDPAEAGGVAAVAQITDRAVITSGGYERFFTDEETGRRFQHIIDPSTGWPVDSGLASVSIICPNGTLGDGLSTALYIMGLEAAADYWRAHSGEFEAIFITDTGDLYLTQGLEACVSSERELHIVQNRAGNIGKN